MRVSEVSLRYARALYDAAKATGSTDKAFAELREVAKAFESDAAIREFILSPVVAPDQKVAALKSLSGKLTDVISNTLLLLAEKNRLGIFSELVSAYEQIIDEDHGVTRGVVTSAAPLGADARKRIEETAAKTTGKKVILSFKEDPTLLGGMVAQVGGWTFDDTLETHLTRMNEKLNRSTH